MSTHWRKILESDYLAGADLDDGKGKFMPIVATIKNARREEVLEPATAKKETCLVLHFHEKLKPMICNVTNAKTIAKVVGSSYIEDWADKRITIKTEKVKAFGEIWDALRVSPKPPESALPTEIKIEIPCADCGSEIQSVGGIPASKIFEGTKKTYGRPLCMTCANAAKAAKEAKTEIPELEAEDPELEPEEISLLGTEGSLFDLDEEDFTDEIK
ncbi:MAG: hypothetical protein PHP22_03485 [Oscillospiraceae bacterium]|jgi:hypothetical protein|nr:hypothetical protein [Oscillospiraceae bacterium]